MTPWIFFLVLVLISIVVEAFFSMMEMACVSYNRLKLHYYVSEGKKRAKWLNSLLSRPTRLFGTTLICVNAAMQFGSECSRRFYDALGLSADWAPLTQVFLVLIFAELAPMLAARRHAEHVTRLGIPVIYIVSKVMTPLLFLLDLLVRFVNWILRIPSDSGLYLTREELQTALEDRDDQSAHGGFEAVAANIFTLRGKRASDLMEPLQKLKMVPSECIASKLRTMLADGYVEYLPVYHKSRDNIVGIVCPRNCITLPDTGQVRSRARLPWFISGDSNILDLLHQFRENNQREAIVLNRKGLASGVLTLDSVIEEVIGEREEWEEALDEEVNPHVVIDRIFSGDTTVKVIETEYDIELWSNKDMTLEEILVLQLGHTPTVGDSIQLDYFSLTLEEKGIMSGSQVHLQSL